MLCFTADIRFSILLRNVTRSVHYHLFAQIIHSFTITSDHLLLLRVCVMNGEFPTLKWNESRTELITYFLFTDFNEMSLLMLNKYRYLDRYKSMFCYILLWVWRKLVLKMDNKLARVRNFALRDFFLTKVGSRILLSRESISKRNLDLASCMFCSVLLFSCPTIAQNIYDCISV